MKNWVAETDSFLALCQATNWCNLRSNWRSGSGASRITLTSASPARSPGPIKQPKTRPRLGTKNPVRSYTRGLTFQLDQFSGASQSPILSFRLVCVMSRCLTHFARYFRIGGGTIRVSGNGISHRQRVAMTAIVLEEVRTV
jgi:hypothetical protein